MDSHFDQNASRAPRTLDEPLVDASPRGKKGNVGAAVPRRAGYETMAGSPRVTSSRRAPCAPRALRPPLSGGEGPTPGPAAGTMRE